MAIKPEWGGGEDPNGPAIKRRTFCGFPKGGHKKLYFKSLGDMSPIRGRCMKKVYFFRQNVKNEKHEKPFLLNPFVCIVTLGVLKKCQ